MKLTVFNGSPRGTGSNTKILLEQFLEGFCENEGNEYEIQYLSNIDRHEDFAGLFGKAEAVLMAFPLYTDAMPGLVKNFIEKLSVLRNNESNPPIAFIVQYGFHEGIHPKALTRYLEKLTRRLNAPLLGIATRGGVEGIQALTPETNRKLFRLFHDLGQGFGAEKQFDPDLVQTLARRERFDLTGKMAESMKTILKETDKYWDRMLAGNDAWRKRFDRPYRD